MKISNDDCDIVTGLPLYDTFISDARQLLENSFGLDQYVLVSTDISNFKYINRIYGYDKANRLLQSLITILTEDESKSIACCRTHSDHIISMYRYGGDKVCFAMKIEEYSHRFIKENARFFSSVTLHLNNGIYYLTDPDEDIVYSIDKANIARRASKGNYCVTSVLFADDMMGRKEEDAKIISLFDRALKENRIKVLYQPKIDIISHSIVGAEALSRIYDDNNKLMYPDVFIPVLENSGKIVELDRYVMKSVFATIRNWIDSGKQPVIVSINLSRMHFYGKNVADGIIEEFKQYDIPVKYIEFELTESLFFAEAEIIISEVNKLRNYGFKVSMDDFGVGYSSLNSLGELPVDIIKFDKGFVKSSMGSDAGYQILLSLINVFKKINYEVICEGIETKADEKMIFECGCDVVQGFLYDRPIPIEEFDLKYIV